MPQGASFIEEEGLLRNGSAGFESVSGRRYMIEGEARLNLLKSARVCLHTGTVRLEMHAPTYCPVMGKGRTPFEGKDERRKRFLRRVQTKHLALPCLAGTAAEWR